MKLHLPILLRRSLLALLTSWAVMPVWGGTLSSEIDLGVYADFGQNCGRYSTSNVNALLQHLNADGVKIYYNNGKDAYTMERGMISFESRQEDNGASAAVNYNFVATVAHNGEQNPYFSYQELGEDQAIRYMGIEYRSPNVYDNGVDGVFVHDAPSSNFQADFKMTRLSKIVTDVTTSTLYSSEKLKQGLVGELLYRSGAGYTDVIDTETGEQTSIERLLTGAIQQIDGNGVSSNGNFWVGHTAEGWNTDVDPLPFGVNQGDSGSPVWVWDDEAGEYRYLGAVALEDGNPANGTTKGNLKFAEDVINSYNKTVESSSEVICLGATSQTDQTLTEGNVSTTLWQGQATDASGKVLATYTAVQKGLNTWNDMAAIRDVDNWYAETENYLNAAQNSTSDTQPDYADLFMTDNLVFQAADRTDYTVQVDVRLDMGIGYTEFTKGNQKSAVYTVTGSGYLDSAGYVIGEDTEVHLKLVSSDRTRELRKIGAGNLYIDGTGGNDILLNVGGSGTTYLNQKNGYAAYNVLINNGATVKLQGGISQVKRDVTFGNGGGVLDFSGQSWTEGAEGHFSLKALTQDAVLSNSLSGTSSVLTFTKGGEFKGSFRDTADAALQVRYAGSETWTLNSIHTHLQHAGSGLFVDKGAVVLVGNNTEHAAADRVNTNHPWNREDDWHYADAAMNVTVANGAVFELGSHARLTGSVTVDAGGVYIMREGVQQQWEYIEGGYTPEDTYLIAAYYGHKGDTVLNGTMKVLFSEGTTANTTYDRNISGSGNMQVDTADGSFTLKGNNTFTGSKELLGGHLIADDVSALGRGEGWQIAAGATLTVQSGITADNLFSLVDKTASSGVLALGNDVAHAVDLSGSELRIGAESGKTVQYGSATEKVAATHLGGGGGTLVLNAQLTGNHELILGQEGASGIVRLNNAANDFSGNISMEGNVALDYASVEALGSATVNLDYGKGMMLRGSVAELKPHLAEESRGALLLDSYTASSVDMSGMGEISLSAAGNATYDGTITVGEGESYRLGGYVGNLRLGQSALSGNHALVVDAKGTTGGTVTLAAQTQFSGAVSVQDGSTDKTGQVTLFLAENNALSGAASTTVNAGGVLLSAAGTTQTLTNLQVNEGGLLKGESGSTLVFNMTSETFQNGAMQLDKAEKGGSGGLVLNSADNEWSLFTVKQGMLFTRVDNALSATGVTRVEKGAVLNLNTWNGTGYTERTMHGHIQLADGAQLNAGTYSGAHVTLTGNVQVDAGATAELYNSHWHLTGSRYNDNGGTLLIDAFSLNLDSAQNQYIGGTVQVDISSTSFNSTQSASGKLKRFNHLSLVSGKNLTLSDSGGNTVWQLDKLTGSGNLTWKSHSASASTSRLILDGTGGFSGSLTVNRSFDQSARPYQAFVEIKGDKAVSGAVIHLNGGKKLDGTANANPANAQITLAVNTANARIGALNGNSYSRLIAGAAPTKSESTLSSPPASTALNTLTITGSATATFSGAVAGDATNGLHLVHAGSGIQNFNGSSVVLHDVASTGGGTLDLSGATALQVLGNVSVGQGSTLNLGTLTYSLDAGKSLSVTGANAVLKSGGLVLNGGTLVFDASVGSGALTFAGNISSSAGATVNFTGLSSDLDGRSLTLAGGDWTSVLSSLSSADLHSMRADFSTNTDGNLVVTFAKNGYLWSGDDSAFTWSASSFGSDTGAPNANSNVSFSDAAEKTTVSVDGYVSAGAMYFENNTSEYVLEDASYSQITTNSLTQSGTGKTVIEAWTLIKSALEVQAGTLVLEDADLNGGSVKVANGTLSMALGENEKISSLELKDGARLELARGGTLTVNNGSRKNVSESLELVSDSTLLDNKSDYVVNGGTMTVGDGSASGSVVVKSVQLTDDGTLNVKSGVLASANGVSFGKGDSGVLLDGGQLVMTSDAKLAAPTEGTAQVTVQKGGALYCAGSAASDKLTLELKDGATLGTSAAMADYAGDIVMQDGNVTVSSAMKYLRSDGKVGSSSLAHVRIAGTLSSAGQNTNLTIDGTGNGSVLLSGTAQVSGKLTVNAGEKLRLAGSMQEQNFEYTQTEGVQLSGRDSSTAATISGGSTLSWDAAQGASIIGSASGSTQVDNALLELKNGASLNLQDIVLSDSSAIRVEENSASLQVNNVQLNVAVSSSSAVVTEQSVTLHRMGAAAETQVLAAGSNVLQLTSSMVQGSLTLAGKGLHLNLSGYNVRDYAAVQVILGSGVDYTAALADVTATFATGNPLTRSAATVEYSGYLSSDGVLYFAAAVPEPATATLSLLALAALAARRRRK